MKKESVNKKEIMEKIMPVIENVSMKNGVIPLEVDFVKESGRWFLRIYIYSYDHSISHKDCENMTRGLNDYLEQLIPVNYYLEVSSPGAERKIKSPIEYEIFKDKKIKLKLKKPIDETENKVFSARIKGYDKSHAILTVDLLEYNKEVEIEESNIASARLCLE